MVSNAQIDLSTEMFYYSDDNIYNSAVKVSDNIMNGALTTSYTSQKGANAFQIYSQQTFTYYQENMITSSYLQKYGVADNYQFSDETQMNFGANYSLKNNRDVFTILDFTQLSAYSNLSHAFSETDMLTGGYIYYNNRFKNFSLFSHSVHKMFLRWNSSFETETSFILSSDVSAKIYPETKISESGSVYQLNLFAQVGQSIAENTGLSLYGQMRKNLTAESRTFYYDNTLFYQDELFNDVFSNEGYEAGISLTKMFSGNAGIKAEINYSSRTFSNLPVFDANGNEVLPNRSDNQLGFGVEYHHDLSRYFSGVSLHLNWNYLINKSNDMLYKYNNQMYSVGFNYSL